MLRRLVGHSEGPVIFAIITGWFVVLFCIIYPFSDAPIMFPPEGAGKDTLGLDHQDITSPGNLTEHYLRYIRLKF